MDDRSKSEQRVKDVIARYVEDEAAQEAIFSVVADAMSDEYQRGHSQGRFDERVVHFG